MPSTENPVFKMAKSKNHTTHNQCKDRSWDFPSATLNFDRVCLHLCLAHLITFEDECIICKKNVILIPLLYQTARKAHRNGIKKPKTLRYDSQKGVCRSSHISNIKMHTCLRFKHCTKLIVIIQKHIAHLPLQLHGL